MAVITFSTTFPKYHPSAGEKTRFVERIWAGLLPVFGEEEMHAYLDEYDGDLWDISYLNWLRINKVVPKIHTIRSGHRWDKGYKFSPRVWSGKPYCSKQVKFAPDLTITDVPNFVMTPNRNIWIGQKDRTLEANSIACYDGLLPKDFWAWFPKPMDGQVIIWGENPYL